jgi:hypothetical protein
MLVTRTSQLTGKTHTLDLDVTQDQLDRFELRLYTGEYAQNIFSNLNKEGREFLISGITDSEWKNAFGEIDL